MTAHGAKGLEAPIVFLPETTTARRRRAARRCWRRDGRRLPVVRVAEGATARPRAGPRAARRREEDEEALRLLYVALTRARDRLVLCGRIAANRKDETLQGLVGAIRAALRPRRHRRPHVRRSPAARCRSSRYRPRPGAAAGAAARRPRAAAVPPGLGRRTPRRRGLRPLRLALGPRRGRPGAGALAAGAVGRAGPLPARRPDPPAAADPARPRAGRPGRRRAGPAGPRARPDRRRSAPR